FEDSVERVGDGRSAFAGGEPMQFLHRFVRSGRARKRANASFRAPGDGLASFALAALSFAHPRRESESLERAASMARSRMCRTALNCAASATNGLDVTPE